jgi:hypothetical protein
VEIIRKAVARISHDRAEKAAPALFHGLGGQAHGSFQEFLVPYAGNLSAHRHDGDSCSVSPPTPF